MSDEVKPEKPVIDKNIIELKQKISYMADSIAEIKKIVKHIYINTKPGG